MTRIRTRKPKPILDPFVTWPKPVGKTSSLTVAANALFARAEASWTRTSDDPWWHLTGAMAHGYDVLEVCRKLYGLPLASTPDDVMSVATDVPLVTERVGADRLRYVGELVRFARAREATS